MNRQFLEFWGRALLLAAKSQKQLEDLGQWFQRGFWGFPDYTQLFQSTYGLEEGAEEDPDYLTLWKKAEEDFRQSFQDYLNLLGVVPREEYAALARENETLKEKVAEQEETIKHLRMLADEKGLGLEATTLEFQRLIKKQGDQFQKFIQGLAETVQSEGKKT
jgi:flagellar motility protein MotE (MotC chaperone)